MTTRACIAVLLVAALAAMAPPAWARPGGRLPAAAVADERAGSAPPGRALALWPGRSAGARVTLPGRASRVVLRARGCRTAPSLTIDGRRVAVRRIARGRWVTVRVPVRLGRGRHRLRLAAGRARCRAPVRVRPVALVLARSHNPLARQRWRIDPDSNAARTEADWRAQGRTADAEHMHLIATHAMASWFGAWNPDPAAAVRQHLANVDASHATQALLVAYQVDLRAQCSPDAAARYAGWIRSFAEGIGSARVAIVLEPDGLGLLHEECATPADRERQLAMFRDAVGVLAHNPNATVYIDAGGTGWIPSAEMAARLRAAGAGQARGIALNVSNFHATRDQVDYGAAVIQAMALPGKRMVIDTSRNGQGSDGRWCNPPGRGLGLAPAADPGLPFVDALLWIKVPGESDGDGAVCRGAGAPPPAGAWWPEYALGLARRHRLGG